MVNTTNKTLCATYISSEINEALRQVCHTKKTSKSKYLLNAILEQLLKDGVQIPTTPNPQVIDNKNVTGLDSEGVQ